MPKCSIIGIRFFAGIGGEEKAGQEVIFLPQAVGIGVEIERSLQQRGVEYATLACGDNYFHEQEEQALQSMRAAIDRFQPDFFLAGPAFNAGRYGIACAKACSWVRDNWRIPAITGMHENNPGTQEIGRQVFVMQTGTSTASMAEAVKRFSVLVELLIAQDPPARKPSAPSIACRFHAASPSEPPSRIMSAPSISCSPSLTAKPTKARSRSSQPRGTRFPI